MCCDVSQCVPLNSAVCFVEWHCVEWYGIVLSGRALC